MGEEEEEEPEVEEGEETEAPPKEEEVHEERPEQKELRDELAFYIAGERVKVRVDAALDRWVGHALSDDVYWMLTELGYNPKTQEPAKKAEGEDDGEEGGGASGLPDLAKKMVLEYQAQGEYSLKPPPEPVEAKEEDGGDGGDAAAAGEEEGEEGEDEEGAAAAEQPEADPAPAADEDDDEPPPPYAVVEVDLFTLIVSQSVECASFFLKAMPGAVSLANAMELACLSLDEQSAGRRLMQDIVGAMQLARGVAPDAGAAPAETTLHRVDFTPIVAAADSCREKAKGAVGEHYAFYERTVELLQNAGAGPSVPMDTSCFTRVEDFMVYYNIIMRAREEDLVKMAAASGDEEEGGDEEGESKPAATGHIPLPPLVMDAFKVFRQLERDGIGRTLRVICPSRPEIDGTYVKRGRENGFPRYWKGDPVKGATPCWLVCHATNGWQIKLGDAVAVMSRSVQTEPGLTPIRPCLWTAAKSPYPKVELHILSEAHAALLPKKLGKVVEVAKADPVLTRFLGYDDVPSVKRVVRASDFLLLTLFLQARNASFVAFEKLLAQKAAKPRPVGDPTGWAHILYMCAGRADCDIVSALIAKTWEPVFRPAGLFSLEAFVNDVVPSLDLRLIAECVPLLFPYVDPSAAYMQNEECAFVAAVKKYEVVYRKAHAMFSQGSCSPEEVGLLRSLREQSKLVFDATTLGVAVRAGNVRGVAYLIDEVGLPPHFREVVYQAGNPVMPYVIQHQLTDMVLMLIDRNLDLNATWDNGLMSGVRFIREHYPAADRDRVLARWKAKTAESESNPALGFGIMRKIAAPDATAA
eukprot:TRINITY_DN32528_c0_g1_i1.p1 TRINITY_DN32528_c0_g1~~TRINITY_DN32528_c0_g1_i1.p1  ORF type:complete len:810 (+),score=308.35 TRINITY_DN32528_c0_g1_i1:69-2498(+)